jgi:hypothetical protein
VLDDVVERLPGVDVVDVDEDAVGAEVACELVVDGARVAGGVVASVDALGAAGGLLAG